MWAPASAAMLTEIDIVRSANALIHEHEEDASLEATHAGGCGVGEGQFGCLLMRTGGRLNVRFGSCVTSIAGPNGAAQLYER